MFKDTIAKIREEVAELEQFDYTSDDLNLASNTTGRIRKWLKELEEDLEAANEKAQKELNELRDEYYHEQLKRYNELKAAKKELAQKDEKIEKLYHDLDDSDREINNLREDNVALVERIEKLENERRISIPCKLIDELQDSREKVEELTKHNDDLRKNYKELCEHINELTQEKESLKLQMDESNKKLEGKNKLIDSMRYKDNKLEEYVDKLNRDISKKDETIKNLNKELATKTMELAAARINSGTRMSMIYIDSNIRVKAVDEAFKAIDEAIKKLDEEVVSKVNEEI